MANRPSVILIVDDEESQRRLLGGFLETVGFQIMEAASAEEMLSMLSAQPPDMILLSQVERATILATLKECDGNRTQAAKKLGISRRTLIYKLRDIKAEQS